MVAEGAAARVDGIKDGCSNLDQALAMGHEGVGVPGQEEVPIGCVPAATKPTEKPSFLQKLHVILKFSTKIGSVEALHICAPLSSHLNRHCEAVFRQYQLSRQGQTQLLAVAAISRKDC